MIKYDWLSIRSKRAFARPQIAHGEKCFALLFPSFVPPISKCLFKFYGSYLSQLSVMFSGLWPRNIPYWARCELSHPDIKINSGACEESEGYTNETDGRVSLWHLRGYSGHFRLTHVEETRKRDIRGMVFTFTRFSGRESREYDLHTGSDHFATYRPLRSCSLCRCFFPLPRSCACRSENPRSFVLVTRQSRVSGNCRR